MILLAKPVIYPITDRRKESSFNTRFHLTYLPNYHYSHPRTLSHIAKTLHFYKGQNGTLAWSRICDNLVHSRIDLREWRLKTHGPGSFFNARIPKQRIHPSLTHTQVATTHSTSHLFCGVVSELHRQRQPQICTTAHTNTRTHPSTYMIVCPLRRTLPPLSQEANSHVFQSDSLFSETRSRYLASSRFGIYHRPGSPSTSIQISKTEGDSAS